MMVRYTGEDQVVYLLQIRGNMSLSNSVSHPIGFDLRDINAIQQPSMGQSGDKNEMIILRLGCGIDPFKHGPSICKIATVQLSALEVFTRYATHVWTLHWYG